MAKTFNELLGDKLIQNNESDEILTDQINGKTVALYFSFVDLFILLKNIFPLFV
jgi:hypothetical protein